MIEVKNLSFSYERTKVIDNLSFSIPKGDFVSLVGPNGAGKTTLVKLLLGILEPKQGEIRIEGNKAGTRKSKDLIGYVPQKYTVESLFPGTVEEILHAQKKKKEGVEKEFGVDKLLKKKFVELSGGQQQRVLIALALRRDPKILILDEPTVGVDIKTQREFFKSLKKLNEEKQITIILVTHDIGMVPTVAKTTICLNHSICCIGHASETEELLKKVYGDHVEHHHH